MSPTSLDHEPRLIGTGAEPFKVPVFSGRAFFLGEGGRNEDMIGRSGSKDWGKRGRRCNEPGAVSVAASMLPDVLMEVELIAISECVSRSWALGLLVEEALKARKEKK
jgi:hypothetical protein